MKHAQIVVKGYPGFVNAMNGPKTVSVEGTSPLSQKKKFGGWSNQTVLGLGYWKNGTVGMVKITAKLLNDYWFDSLGTLQRQHISMK